MGQLEAGARLGSYQIEGFIAEGGMGAVYAARDGLYGTPVALKVLHANLTADADWRLRFNEEGLVGQQLKHPNVLAARELVEADGRVALVLDLVRGGQTLSRVLQREYPNGLPLEAALQVLLAIIHGVEYAHGKGIVHGDLKPENVMVRGESRDPTTWAPLVTDFGTVGLIAHPVVIDGRPAVVASPRYASPEHLLGVDRLEPRSDVYSLGLLLHFLLTGRHVSEARSVEEAALSVATAPPVVHLVDQPASVLALFQRAAAPSPGERYPNCRELALAVRAVLDERGVQPDVEDLESEIATELVEGRAPATPASSREGEIPSLVPRPLESGGVAQSGDRAAEASPAPSAEKEAIPLVAWVGIVVALAMFSIIAVFMAHG